MGRRRGIMSDQMKEELAKELGFYDVVQKEGWGGIKARDAGNMVKRAIEIAEQQLTNRQSINDFVLPKVNKQSIPVKSRGDCLGFFFVIIFFCISKWC